MGRKLTKPRPPQGAHLANLRKSAGLSQKELAQIVGESQGNIAFWEVSDKPPRSALLPKLARALGVNVVDLIIGDSKSKKPNNPKPRGRLQILFHQLKALPRSHQQRILDLLAILIQSAHQSLNIAANKMMANNTAAKSHALPAAKGHKDQAVINGHNAQDADTGAAAGAAGAAKGADVGAATKAVKTRKTGSNSKTGKTQNLGRIGKFGKSGKPGKPGKSGKSGKLDTSLNGLSVNNNSKKSNSPSPSSISKTIKSSKK